ncbi:nicotinamidase [Novymonas esmeraldas]|uniref:nicotinamidase n=1 Tax=Novymonas esmeraldas TaxID=1808958 RepID=A0AAW0EL44_9TRYP
MSASVDAAAAAASVAVAISAVSDALLIVDMQNDFLLADAPLLVTGGAALVDGINAISAALPFRCQVASQDWHPTHHCSFAEQGGPWPPHCRRGSAGAELHAALITSHVSAVVRKGTSVQADSYSAFMDTNGTATGLEGLLRSCGVQRVFVCGVALDYCVHATAMDARKCGFAVVVLEDLTAAVDDAAWPARTAELAEAGVAVLPSTALVAESGDGARQT